jgi:competence protein ComGC|nr:MAG TPA: Restriction endonuclease [Caudoviricetes sp.]
MDGVLLIIVVLCVVVIVVLLLGIFQKNEPVADMTYFNSTINMLRNQIERWKADFTRQGEELQKIKKEKSILADLNARQVDLIRQLESDVESKLKMINKQTVELSNQKTVVHGLNFEKNELQDLNAKLKKELDEAEYIYRELYDKYECAKSDIKNLEQKVDDFDQMINAKNPFDYVAHLRAHALEHKNMYIDSNVEGLASLFKYQYKFEYLLSIYPELGKFKDDDAYINYMHEEEKRCNIRNWLSDNEYFQMTEQGREQLAVDRYISDSSKWSDWEKGRNYEIYCAYKLFNEDYDIIQEGLNKKLEDGGRDIIATHKKTGKILIVQCKNWSSLVRENVVFQLYGSFVQWKLDNEDKIKGVEVEPWLYITCDLSPEAIKCANLLGVKVRRLPMDRFPAIKCNINHNTGHKIYHLPFDRHYDLVKINAKGKGYKFEIAEAIQEGFRRAYNH